MTENEEIEDRQRGRKRSETGIYASKYYDPDKAHEYYMKHRKLKALASGGKKTKKATKSRKRSGRKSKKTRSSGYSQQEKDLLQGAKQNIEDNIANLKDLVADWQDKQEEAIDNAKSS